jgi:hypothetical protein
MVECAAMARPATRKTAAVSQRGVVPGWTTSLAAGAMAGVVAALLSVVVEIVALSPVPPRAATVWSAFVAGILGGLMYGALCRTVRRPVVALWVVTLALATIDSLLIAVRPGASGRSPNLGIPLSGLVTPVRQLLALVGVGHLGTRRFPQAYLPVATVIHYIAAVAVALLVPWWAKPRQP